MTDIHALVSDETLAKLKKQHEVIAYMKGGRWTFAQTVGLILERAIERD